MPIYAYRCAACSHAQDVLQKLSDPVLTICPACGAAAYTKQVTAAGFQLKGSGWYVTDFRGGNAAKPDAKDEAKPAADDKAAAAKPADGAATANPTPAADGSAAKPAATPAATTPAAAPAKPTPPAAGG